MKLAIVLAAGVVAAAVSASAQAALVHQWTFNNPTPLAESPNGHLMTTTNAGTTPTYLPTGGVAGSGAYQFDGVDDFFVPTTFNGPYAFLGVNTASWTASFWIKTTDSGTIGGHLAQMKVPALGTNDGGAGFGLGVDGGLATWKHFNGSIWEIHQGTTNIADGTGHFLTFVSHGMTSLDIYVDGYPQAMGVATVAAGSAELSGHFGSHYNNVYGALTLDDVRIYNTALTGEQLRTLINIPEPASIGLLLAGVAMLATNRRRS